MQASAEFQRTGRTPTGVGTPESASPSGYTILPFEWRNQPFFGPGAGGTELRPAFEHWLVRDEKSDRIQRFFSLFLRLLPNPSLSLKGSTLARWAKRHRSLTYVVISTLAYMARKNP